MAKRAENIFYAEGFDGIENSVNEMHACSAEPTTYTEAKTTFSLGSVAMAAVDFTQADGSPDGRKITVAAKTVTGSANGNANHLALIETGTTTLWYATTTTLVGITNGVGQDFSAWDILQRDPT